MKLLQAIREVISANRYFFGAEFFPPHMDSGRLKLYDAMERLFHQAGPLFCGVTTGDRGSTAQETTEICDAAQRLAPVLMQAHITGSGLTEQQMMELLEELKRRDITNLFLLRGVQAPAQVGGKSGSGMGGTSSVLSCANRSASFASSSATMSTTATTAVSTTAVSASSPSAVVSDGDKSTNSPPVIRKFHLSRRQSSATTPLQAQQQSQNPALSSSSSSYGSTPRGAHQQTPQSEAAGSGFVSRVPDDSAASPSSGPGSASAMATAAVAAAPGVCSSFAGLASVTASGLAPSSLSASPSSVRAGGAAADEAPRYPFEHAVDLVRFVRKHFGDFFGITVAGYPEGHTEANGESAEERATEIRYLKEKVDAGADLVICQAVFDARTFLRFCEECRSAGITVPIIPSVVPLHSASQLKRMANLRRLKGMDVLEQRLREMGKSGDQSLDDDEAVRSVVVEFTAQLVRQLFRAGVRGVYFMTQNIDSVTRKVIAQVSELSNGGSAATLASMMVDGSGSNLMDMAAAAAASDGMAIMISTPVTAAEQQRPLPWRPSLRVTESARPIYWSSRPSSYLAALEGIPLVGAGEKLQDQHPNGRWSNTSSPAFFGEESTYQHVAALVNASAKLCTVFVQAKTVHDVASCFVDFLSGKGSLPWSCVEGLAPESNVLISTVLLPMNRRGLLTINSQPAVNGAPSADPTYGWGPRGGYVYQKQYLEFFCSPAALNIVLSALEQRPSVVYMAQTAARRGRRSNMPNAAAWIEQGNNSGECGEDDESQRRKKMRAAAQLKEEARGNSNSSSGAGGGLHAAVTWGVFPSSDIQQPTFISSSAFDLWTPEAFTMWLYPFQGTNHKNRAPPAVIQDIVDKWYLVTALDNDYISAVSPLNEAIFKLCEVLPEI